MNQVKFRKGQDRSGRAVFPASRSSPLRAAPRGVQPELDATVCKSLLKTDLQWTSEDLQPVFKACKERDRRSVGCFKAPLKVKTK